MDNISPSDLSQAGFLFIIVPVITAHTTILSSFQIAMLKIRLTVVAMPLFTDLPAGSAHERHRHGTAYGADLLGVCRFAVGTDDTLAAGEVLLLLNFILPFSDILNNFFVLLICT